MHFISIGVYLTLTFYNVNHLRLREWRISTTKQTQNETKHTILKGGLWQRKFEARGIPNSITKKKKKKNILHFYI